MTPKTRTRDAKTEDTHTAATPASLRESNAPSFHLRGLTHFKKGKRMWRCVLTVLVTIPACSHERPERHAHCRVRDDGVPVLHVEPICTECASFVSSSRSSNRTTTRSSPHARIPGIVDTSKTKAQIWAKGTTEHTSLLIKKTKPQKTEKYPAKEFISITV